MSSDFKFVSTDTEALTAAMISVYERMTNASVHPASPEHLFILWVTDVIVQTRAQINFAANQNIPSRASGENLDALGELFYDKDRPEAAAATCTMRFNISEVQSSSILIPEGTRVTDASGNLFWETVSDAYVAIGDIYADVQIRCMTAGGAGNGYAVGQINSLVDLFPYSAKCMNITPSDGGSDRATDAQYYELLRTSEDAYSTAGPMGSYIYWAKSVSTDIADVAAIMPKDPATGEFMGGHVNIYALMSDGSIASDTIKSLILSACNDSEVRPLTDFVSTEDPELSEYNIDFTYYIPMDTKQSAAEIQQAVERAVDKFIQWQSIKLGRDINPSKLISMLMETGVKRIDLTEPVFTVLSDGSDSTAPAVAKVSAVTITNGGYEND
jgi:Phage-related baseplate assembly protein